MNTISTQSDVWPALPFPEWQNTCATLHRWAQIVGKIRIARTAWVNHSWHATLYVTARGLTTSPIPYGARTFQIDFDFLNHKLITLTSDGGLKTMTLVSCSVADFYQELMSQLAELNLTIKINTTPNEIVDAVPFEQDHQHASYDPDYANRFWRILVQTDRLFKQFRSGFIGKCSPVHFFWGSFDLAVTRFSGRLAPEHAGGVPNLPDWIAREAYSHEVSSCGFWPGSEQMPQAAYYAYAYPEPTDYGKAKVGPAAAAYNHDLKEFILPYDDVRRATSPDEALLEFLQSTYAAAADTGGWDRAALERSYPFLKTQGT